MDSCYCDFVVVFPPAAQSFCLFLFPSSPIPPPIPFLWKEFYLFASVVLHKFKVYVSYAVSVYNYCCCDYFNQILQLCSVYVYIYIYIFFFICLIIVGNIYSIIVSCHVCFNLCTFNLSFVFLSSLMCARTHTHMCACA